MALHHVLISLVVPALFLAETYWSFDVFYIFKREIDGSSNIYTYLQALRSI